MICKGVEELQVWANNNIFDQLFCFICHSLVFVGELLVLFCIFHSQYILLLYTKYISLVVKLKIKQRTTFWKNCNSRQDQLLPFYLTTHPILWFICGGFCFFIYSFTIMFYNNLKEGCDSENLSNKSSLDLWFLCFVSMKLKSQLHYVLQINFEICFMMIAMPSSNLGWGSCFNCSVVRIINDTLQNVETTLMYSWILTL